MSKDNPPDQKKSEHPKGFKFEACAAEARLKSPGGKM